MFYLVIILFGVGWILASVIRNYSNKKSPISHKYLNHGTLMCAYVLELITYYRKILISDLDKYPKNKFYKPKVFYFDLRIRNFTYFS